MKKLIPFFVIALIFVALASCKKDYVCECNGVGVTFTYDTIMHDMSKNDAEEECNDLDYTFWGYGQDCNLE